MAIFQNESSYIGFVCDVQGNEGIIDYAYYDDGALLAEVTFTDDTFAQVDLTHATVDYQNKFIVA
jgi:hypothetical protein